MPSRPISPRVARRAAASAVLTLAVCFCSTAVADARLWDGNNANPPSGRFATAASWVGNVAPTAADGAIFKVGPTANYVVTFFSPSINPIAYETDYLRVGSNAVTFQNNVAKTSYTVTRPPTGENLRGIIIGESSGEAAVLTTLMPFAGVAATLGDGGGATGTLNVSASAFTITGDGPDAELIVGNHGAGRLNVGGGAQLNVSGAQGNSIIGNHPGSDGRVTVNGGAAWNHAGTTDLLVGLQGYGSLTVTTGGVVTTRGRGIVGVATGVTGAVTVDGPGSQWNVVGELTVAGQGNGRMDVTNGGRVTSSSGVLGSTFPQPPNPPAAEVHVTGAGSTWNSGSLRISSVRPGLLNIGPGGTVNSQGASVANNDYTSAGRAIVSGAAATWNNTGTLSVGNRFPPLSQFPVGRLEITGGGRVVNTGDVNLGRASFVTIDGTGSELSVSGRFDVELGSTLDVVNGGTLTAAQGLVANTLRLDGGIVDVQNHNLTLPSTTSIRSGTIRNATILYGSLVKTTGGTLTLDGVAFADQGTAVNAGTLVYNTSHTAQALDIADGANVRLARSAATPRDVVLKAAGVNTHAAGGLDLTDNKLIVANGGLAAIRSLVTSAYNGGAWDGPGITTSAATPATSLGVALAQDVGLAGGTFGGVPVAFGDVLVMYTLAADANLDGLVDFKDLVRVAQSYNAVGTEWSRGDFNYDGVTGFNDLVKLAQNYNTALPIPPVPGAASGFEDDLVRALASVPEPSCAIYAALCICACARRRRPTRSTSPGAPARRTPCPRRRIGSAGRP